MERSSPVLVPLDGSALAEGALAAAIDLCRWTGRRLHAVRVHAQPSAPSATAPETDLAGALRAGEEAYLRDVASRCGARAGLAIRTTLLDGSPATALATYIQEHGVGLVVMTTHGGNGVNRAWLGSVADALVRRVRVPVLLLRPDPERTCLQPQGTLRHVLVPVDGSELSARVLGPAASFMGVPNARLTLLHVLANPTRHAMNGAALQELRDDAELTLDELAAPLRARGRRVDVAIVWSDNPALAILGFAASEQVDAIALATRGQGGPTRHAVGSVADKVMRASLLPLLLYRPPALDSPADADTARELEVIGGTTSRGALRAG